MKKVLVLGFILIALLASVGAVSAATLSLVQKDGPPNWNTVDEGATGTLTYSYANGPWSFSGTGLVPGVKYSLISYKEPWNGVGSIYIDEGTSDEDGDISISGGSLNLVLNTYAVEDPGDYPGETGAKIWLVRSADLDLEEDGGDWECLGFNAWNFDSYLFETELIDPNEMPAPEFPTMALPAALIVGMLGAVLFIQRTKQN